MGVADEEIEAVVVVVVVRIKVKAGRVVGGHQVVQGLLGVVALTSPDIQIILPVQSVKNITFLENLLIGVKNQQHVHGKTSLFQKINETLTSLILTKLLTLYITDSTRKYMPLPF